MAALPLVLVLAAVAWQLVLAGHAAWMTAHAARAGARADVVGAPVGPAVRSALPAGLERGLQVEREGGVVRVGVRIPLLLHRWQTPLRVGASASLGEGG